MCALSASYISTFVGYPVRLLSSYRLCSVIPLFGQLDSLKSRLQTTKTRTPILTLAGLVYREEGLIGFYRGLWIPLVTISFVRELIVFRSPWPLEHSLGTASFTIYSGTKEYCNRKNYFSGDNMYDAAFAGGISGALSGSLISLGSARASSIFFYSITETANRRYSIRTRESTSDQWHLTYHNPLIVVY